MTVHTYKQGNDLVITIPSEFKVKENRDYQAEILPDGTIKFIPKDSRSQIFGMMTQRILLHLTKKLVHLMMG